MKREELIETFALFGKILENFKNSNENISFLNEVKANNPWFTKENILLAFENWSSELTQEKLSFFVQNARFLEKPKTLALILAGNIPMVGFHDILCGLLCGYHLQIKLSGKDKLLSSWVLQSLVEIRPNLKERISVVEKLENFDTAIATGSNNTAKYFSSYFKNIPHIIRQNRTSIAVLTGQETKEELSLLSNDVFDYFGLGCRNVSKVFIPEDFDLNRLFEAFFPHNDIINHHKYANNFDYYRAIYLLNQDNFMENGFLLLKEDSGLHTPVSVLFYSRYQVLNQVENFIDSHQDELQCIVSNLGLKNTDFGKSQKPKLDDFADGVNTLAFLSSI
ncbi:MAG: acyl-CoA reductase [Flavobacteriaceae bacterium]|nr:MAG: acyl-CoA reductase [Flavobacteriaceae bacterium]